jgi:hypothetical protein
VTRGWRKFYTAQIHNMRSFVSIIRMIKSKKMRWVEHVGLMGDLRNVYQVLVEKPEGKRSLGRLSHRPEHNIKMDEPYPVIL